MVFEKAFREDEGGGNQQNQKTSKSKKEKPCRACHDFKSWAKLQTNDNPNFPNSAQMQSSQPPAASAECPLDKDELGKNTWSFLHTMAAYFPDNPTEKEQKEMSVFVKLFSKYYPCDHCAKDFRQSIAVSPPETTSRWNFSQWMCKMHNEVNRKLGKEEFDCSLVDQRWKDGWEDGSCG